MVGLARDPLRQTAGAEPPQLVCRSAVLDEVVYGLRMRSGAPGVVGAATTAPKSSDVMAYT